MKIASLIAALTLATSLAGAPAFAKTTLSKGQKLCEAAAKAAQPAPKSVRADSDQTRANDATITVTLRVKNADDTSSKLTCKVDRETGGVVGAGLVAVGGGVRRGISDQA
jgi:archaellum component FlaG (FlaF/FlaG flagellin family)